MGKRVVIVDINHVAHLYQFGSSPYLSIKVKEGDQLVEKSTGIQTGLIKSIHRWSNHGANPMAVCFDRPVPSRKAFFQSSFSDMVVGSKNEYKGGREKMPEEMFVALADTERILRSAGVSCFAEPNYESDDLVYACIQRAKVKYPDLPIDVITNDADLLPLVDDRVSVFFRSRKASYAESKDILKPKYIQVTPRNFQEVVEDLSNYKGFTIPYNSILLHKLLRGDTSDKIETKTISKMFPPTKYNKMVQAMLDDRVNFAEIFRYGEPTYKILYRGTDEEFNGTMKDALASPDKTKLYQKVGNSEQLDAILEILKEYSDLNEEQLEVLEKLYWGMNLNQAYPNPDPRLSRRSYVLAEKGHGDINSFNEIELHKAAYSSLQIKLLR